MSSFIFLVIVLVHSLWRCHKFVQITKSEDF